MANRSGSRIVRLYVSTLLAVVGRSLHAASQIDPVLRKEIEAFPSGFVIQVRVLPDGPGVALRKCEAGHLVYLGGEPPAKADLGLLFKHLAHAFLVLSFQEGTARAFANARTVVDGEIAHAIRIVRCLNRLECLILPRRVAERAVKRYPEIPFAAKLRLGARIYGRVAVNLFAGNPT